MTRTNRLAAALCALVALAAWPAPAAAQGLLERLRQAADSARKAAARSSPAAAAADRAISIARTLLPISTAKEIEIGRGIAATIAGRFPISSDVALTRYVNLVGLTVASQAPRPDVDYRFAVLETPSVNAFAAPGGYIFVTRGALDLMESEAELAGVLAHEVGHVNWRHVIEQLRKSDTMREVRDQVNLTGAVMDLVVGTGANVLFTGLSRDDELEADSLGLEYATAAGYDPGGLASFVSRLDRHAGEGSLAEFFATHPQPSERTNRLNGIVQRESLTAGPTLAERYQENVKKR